MIKVNETAILKVVLQFAGAAAKIAKQNLWLLIFCMLSFCVASVYYSFVAMFDFFPDKYFKKYKQHKGVVFSSLH